MLNVLLLLRCNQLLVLQEFLLLLLLLLLLHHCMLLLHQLLLLHVLHVLHVLLLLLLLRQVQMGPGRTRWHVRCAHLHVATCWRHRHMVQRRADDTNRNGEDHDAKNAEEDAEYGAGSREINQTPFTH